MKLTRTSKLIALAGAVAMTPALALGAVTVGDELGTTLEAVRAQLEKEGYTVTEFDDDDGEIEIEATKDGLEIEFVVTEAGKVIEIELEDEAEMDDEDDDD
ncbi:MAG: PepSY domain-containing protein [Hyphomicrobiales bacterium]|nr:PepSY domain-containing protein [Hyphomicrobiales bacterium]